MDDLVEPQSQPVLGRQVGDDCVELFAVFFGAGLEVGLADLVGLVGEDLVHALADVPLEVDVLQERLGDAGVDEPAEEVVEEFGLGGEVGQKRADEGVGGDAGRCRG
ncbi:hypothetical protein [Actinomadura sp. 3N407]|uniref:hypothetical protein n=1 Tax=Actinomadura sp. 3N407 TaxID=3457423 RepID=UPI003FCE676D